MTFDKDVTQETVPDCPFCYENAKLRVVDEFDSVFTIKDGFPVTDGHLLIIPKRHISDYFALTEKERQDAESLIKILRQRISEKDPSVTGFNVGANSGESAGQTIFHAHIHLIPRRDGDTPNPRGGVRGVIPGKMDYCSETKKMHKLKTWAGRSEFKYTGSIKDGTEIYYGKKYKYKVKVSSANYSALIKKFSGSTVNIGTSRDVPPSGSVGEWLQKNVTKTAIASYVGPILISDGYAEKIGRSSQIRIHSL